LIFLIKLKPEQPPFDVFPDHAVLAFLKAGEKGVAEQKGLWVAGIGCLGKGFCRILGVSTEGRQ
jgi:hypothetical protein